VAVSLVPVTTPVDGLIMIVPVRSLSPPLLLLLLLLLSLKVGDASFLHAARESVSKSVVVRMRRILVRKDWGGGGGGGARFVSSFYRPFSSKKLIFDEFCSFSRSAAVKLLF